MKAVIAVVAVLAIQYVLSIPPRQQRCGNMDDFFSCYNGGGICVTQNSSSACVEAYDNPDYMDCACTYVGFEDVEQLPCRNPTQQNKCGFLHGVCVDRANTAVACAQNPDSLEYDCVCIINTNPQKKQ